MNLTTELKAQAVTVAFPQNNLANWCKQAPFTRHTPEAGLNALVDCSAAAFEHIYALTQQPLSSEAKQNIAQLLETLQQHYQQLGYSQDISLAAHYAICATLDDILRHHAKHSLHTTTQHTDDAQFLQSFHQSRLEQEKFYSILEHISPQADKYIDLLELMYLCLRFGYKGQYRNTPFGLQQWSLLTDGTYRLITNIRGQHSHILSPNLPETAPIAAPHATPTVKKPHRFYAIVSLVFILLAVAAGLVFRETYNTTREALIMHDTTPTTQQEMAP